MQQIKLTSVTRDTISYEAGVELALHILPLMADQQRVKLSLTDVNGFSTSFMQGAFGRLIDEFGIQCVRDAFVFRHLTSFLKQQLQDYFQQYAEATASA